MCIHIFACQEISGIALAAEGSWWPPAASGSPSSGFPGGNLLPWVRAWEQSEMPVEVVTWWGSWGGRRRAVPSSAVPRHAVLCRVVPWPSHGDGKPWPCQAVATLVRGCAVTFLWPRCDRAMATPCRCCAMTVPCRGCAVPWPCRGPHRDNVMLGLCHAVPLLWRCCALSLAM